MAFLTEAEGRKLAERVLSFGSAPELQVFLNPGMNANTRFARNEVSTSGYIEPCVVTVAAQYGMKKGVSNTNQLDDESLKTVVRRAEELARLSPDDPETMPLIGPQKYIPRVGAFDDAAKVNADACARIAAEAIKKSEEKGLIAAGFIEHMHDCDVIANNKGLFGYQTTTGISYSVTVRSPDGTGSGWGGGTANQLSLFDPSSMTARAVDLAVRSQKPVALEPGNYTVVMPAECVADMVSTFGNGGLDARQADEGRSFMAKAGGGTKLGEKMFAERVNLYTDPTRAECPGNTWSGEGLASQRIDWVKNGVVKNLNYSRYWAQKQGKQPTPGVVNMIMDGGTSSIDEMIASTKRGLLLTRLWYIRFVDPQTYLLTGLTRDGLFLIENGKVTKPVKNFRWNETPVKVLRNIEMMGPQRRVITSEQDLNSSLLFPSLKVSDFTFSSLSDAV
ncbi:MAG: TldD/PmbA family protein [Thermoanaerobaculia bacterium]